MSDQVLPTRRTLLGAAALAAASVPFRVFAQSTQGGVPARPPKLADDLVREFVVAGHGDFDKVKKMLADHPGLLNATWDWGGGDFESAIGGAGHMGRADIARFLIDQGARYDIFVAAMLGQLDLVKAALTATPSLAKSKGPHGIPLIVHAQKGGAEAKRVLEYLEALQ